LTPTRRPPTGNHHTDQPTSAAAAAFADCKTHRQAVARVFRRAGCPLSAWMLARLLVGVCSPESVRRCVCEFRREEKIVQARPVRNPSGCMARAWWWGG